ncbi:DUF4199 domain-containing protein [Inquilinus sp. KBS0705]|nr:DUF4199 domain-containing protein [Inquilinus sp. KBS0705]
MKRIVLVFGLIAGLIVSAWLVGGLALCYNSGSFEGNMLLGYASMIIAFAFVFIGVKNYRDKYNNGVVSFGKAFQIGLYITLIASSMYVVVWLIDYYVFIPDFMDKYSAHMITKIQSSSASIAEKADKISGINKMKEMYRSPAWVVLMTYLEIFPVGLVVTIITALILKRKATNGNVLAVD